MCRLAKAAMPMHSSVVMTRMLYRGGGSLPASTNSLSIRTASTMTDTPAQLSCAPCSQAWPYSQISRDGSIPGSTAVTHWAAPS
jgi:hypothetical protein